MSEHIKKPILIRYSCMLRQTKLSKLLIMKAQLNALNVENEQINET